MPFATPIKPAFYRYLAQVPLTVLILVFVPSNLGKLIALLAVWSMTFRTIRRVELAFVLIVCVFFSVMNAMSLSQGIFAFSRPDLLGMPAYEFVMWGFYLLHTSRLLGGPLAPAPTGVTWTLALLYSATFATLHDPVLLLLVAGALLVIGLVVYHERHDLYYAGYMIVLGAVIEYTGVLSGEWHYPGNPAGGVPLWFITLWGGVGLFLRRLALPIVARFDATKPSSLGNN